jgi:hypothetical protein
MKPTLYKQKVLVAMTEQMLIEIDKKALQESTSRNQAIRSIIAKGLLVQ